MMTAIKATIEAAGMDIAEVSRAVASHPSNVYRLVAGKAPAGARVRAKFARALGVPEGDLFDGQGWPKTVEVTH